MQYLGAAKAYVLTTHGNTSSDSTKVYTRTCPPVLDSIKQGLDNSKEPVNVNNNLKHSAEGIEAAAVAPSNI